MLEQGAGCILFISLVHGKHLCISLEIRAIASEKHTAPSPIFLFITPATGTRILAICVAQKGLRHSKAWQISMQKKPNPVVNPAITRPK